MNAPRTRPGRHKVGQKQPVVLHNNARCARLAKQGVSKQAVRHLGVPIASRAETPAPYRRVARWEHEQVIDAMQARLERMPQASRLRRQTVEHPFATLKAWMGSSHFLTKTLPKVRTEMSLHVLAYNMKRMMAIFGVQPLLQAMRA